MHFEISVYLLAITYDARFHTFHVSQPLSIPEFSGIEGSIRKNIKQLALGSHDASFLTMKEQNDRKLHLYYWVPLNLEKITMKLSNFTDLRYVELDDLVSKPLKKIVKQMVASFDTTFLSTLLGETFTIDHIYDMYTMTVNPDIDKGNFHRMFKNAVTIEATGDFVQNVSYRPPKVYRFK